MPLEHPSGIDVFYSPWDGSWDGFSRDVWFFFGGIGFATLHVYGTVRL